ncbi:TonB-dependent receptor [Marivirga atlantica]|uniref:TonB-dependent receptor n=1 Tax=Marivirga atlantica TaxID=1548457 RepID=A0A937A9Q8_9BACT|nr:TonB-dependent receptor [Marivirga atlantica]MBL0764865.1 TonB-dependent receptor [Marivirga atlantica]
MRVFLIIILFATANLALGQDQMQDSLLRLDEVAVYGSNAQLNLVGSRVIVPDENLVAFNKQASLTGFLNSQSSTYLKSYGNNMLSTISFRGTNASQTSVLWNNFSINNYTLGQTDFSTVPLSVTDEVTLIPGGGSSFGGSGAIGGTVALANPLSYRKNMTAEIQQSVGSFNTYRTLGSFEKSTEKLSYKINAYYNVSENDFLIPERNLRQEHAAYQSYGALTALGYKLTDDQKLEFSLWYNDNYREIQPTLSGGSNNSDQQDENLRTSIQYQLQSRFFQLHSGIGYFNDKLDYKDGLARSLYIVNRIEGFSKITTSLAKNHIVEAELRGNVISAQNPGYEQEQAFEERYSIMVQSRGELFQKINYAAHIKQQYISDSPESPLSPYLGLAYQLFQRSRHKLKLKVSSSVNYRIPTLNDRFWQNAGDPELKTERGFNNELGLELNSGISNLQNNFSVTTYRNLISDYIQWKPTNMGNSRPENVKTVEILGLELNNQTSFRVNELKLGLDLAYSFTNSTVLEAEREIEIGKHLVYVPSHKANVSLFTTYKVWRLSYLANYTGKVYTSQVNTEVYALPQFILHDVGFQYALPSGITCGFRIRNALNTNYQTYAGYAMPGRNYELTLNYNFKSNN